MLLFNILIVLLHFASSEVILSSGLLKACLELKGISRSAVYVERNNGSKTYQDLNYQWNLRHGTITPLAYFLPTCRHNVQKAIRCGRKLGIRMVAKSGGQSFEKYSYGDSNTVVIDLQKMSKVKVNPTTLTAEVGAGILNGPLYWELWTNGEFGFPGAFITTGVAGVILGGGFGEWSKQFGLMTDNVVRMDFVTPKGKFLILSKTRNADLFWALRGAGGGNFGIVTEFKFKIFQAASLKTNRITLEFGATKLKKLFGVFQSVAKETLDGIPCLVFRANSESMSILSTNTNMTAQNVKDKLAEFGVKPDDVKILHQSLNFIENVAASAFPSVSTPSKLGLLKRKDFPKFFLRAKSYFLKKMFSQADIASLEQLFLQMPKHIMVSIDVLGGAINRVSSTATSFVHRNSVLRIQVIISAGNKVVDEWVKVFDEYMLRTQSSEESYQNCDDKELVSHGEYLNRYYGKNLARLVGIKKVIDPDDYFKFPQSIPLALPE